MTWAFENGPSNSTQRFVLVALADFANSDGEAWPAVETIANKCSLSGRSVVNCLNALVDGGYIKRQRRFQKTNVYTFDCISEPSAHIEPHKCTTFTPYVNVVHPISERGSPEPLLEPSIEPSLFEDDKDFELTPLMEISTHFTNLTHIPERPQPKWIEACKEMADGGITTDDMTKAVAILRDKNYKITGPWSLINTATTVMSERKMGADAPATSGYASETY